MKKSEELSFVKLYDEFMENMRGYIEKDNTKKMFYSIIYVLYLAKKSNKDLSRLLEDKAFDPITLSNRKNINKILHTLIYEYEKLNVYTSELEILKEIRSSFENNGFNEEINSNLSSQIIDLTEKEIKEITKSSLEIDFEVKGSDESTFEITKLVSYLLDINEKDNVLDQTCPIMIQRLSDIFQRNPLISMGI